MRFLADECCDFAIVRALRAAGHDVRAVAEEAPQSPDTRVIAEAALEQRILITEDKDFGWLTYVAQADSAGVILVRFPATARQAACEALVALVTHHAAELAGGFTVVQPGQARITRRP